MIDSQPSNSRPLFFVKYIKEQKRLMMVRVGEKEFECEPFKRNILFVSYIYIDFKSIWNNSKTAKTQEILLVFYYYVWMTLFFFVNFLDDNMGSYTEFLLVKYVNLYRCM